MKPSIAGAAAKVIKECKSGTVADSPELSLLQREFRLQAVPLNDEHHLPIAIAVAISPISALQYTSNDPCPRWKHIYNYLKLNSPLNNESLESLNHLLAMVLDARDTKRQLTPRVKQTLIKRDGNWCNICRSPFTVDPMSVKTRDPYRPTWKSKEELTKAEIDHNTPIS